MLFSRHTILVTASSSFTLRVPLPSLSYFFTKARNFASGKCAASILAGPVSAVGSGSSGSSRVEGSGVSATAASTTSISPPTGSPYTAALPNSAA